MGSTVNVDAMCIRYKQCYVIHVDEINLQREIHFCGIISTAYDGIYLHAYIIVPTSLNCNYTPYLCIVVEVPHVYQLKQQAIFIWLR